MPNANKYENKLILFILIHIGISGDGRRSKRNNKLKHCYPIKYIIE